MPDQKFAYKNFKYTKMMLSKINLPPLLIREDEFNESGCFWQHENEEDYSLNIGSFQFYPQWTSVIHGSSENVNSFCPYCGSFVREAQKLQSWIEGVDAVCRAHAKCVQKKQNFQIHLKFRKSIYTLQKGYLEISPSNNQLGGKEFVISASICHPLSNYKYFQTDKKIAMEEGNVLFNINPTTESWSTFTANRILLPIPEMNFRIGLKQIGSQAQTQNIDFSVDLSQIFVGLQITEKLSAWVITFSNQSGWTASIEIQLIFDETEKRRQIDMMNFKYPHPIISVLPLVKVNKIVLTPKTEDKIVKLGISNTKASSNFDDFYEEVEEQTMTLSSSVAPPKQSESKNVSELKKLAKTQAGSKQIQRRLRDMKTEELSFLIDEILPCLQELLEDDYANYMVQTLVSYSNSQQRLKIFKSLNKEIVNLVCLKQGTFAFQQMIVHIHTEEEFSFFGQLMAQYFFQVSTNPNGNHFLRKLIPMMPFRFNLPLIDSIFTNFLELVNDKNAVCVLKVILRILSKQDQNPEIKEIVKKLIKQMTANTEQIIKNEFGNYFIQEAYEIFGEREMREISEFIFSKFRALAKEKFSSSVICRCLSAYWKETDYLKGLKSKLNTAEIVELFKNKEGNKVLLELMNSHADEGFKGRIMKAIEKFMPSKFNSSKWVGVGMGPVKTGKGNNLSLSEGVKVSEKKGLH